SATPRLEPISRLVDEGKWDEAERRYLLEIERSSSSQALNDLGVLYFRKGDNQKGQLFFSRAINASPPYLRSFFNRGILLARMGKYVDAARDYETFLDSFPNHFEASYNLGVAYIKLERYERAVDVLKKASSLAGGERKAKALYNMGIAYRRMGRKWSTEARDAMNRAIRLKP
ncbi:MAG: tetratricopeptide repeat protein, partial [Gammaproteobacteria bacterium]|nr:tetratricopeptide repeat protein [Gammaproteobacteria bacterium]